MQKLPRYFVITLLGIAPLAIVAQPTIPAEEKAAPAVTPVPASQAEAIAFLDELEAKNRDVKTLYGEFKQLRLN